MASNQSTPVSEPTIELTTNNKPTDTVKPKVAGCTCNPVPTLEHQETKDTVASFFDEDNERLPRARRRGAPRHFSPSPVRLPESAIIPSSTKLLSYVGKYDGVADLMDPTRRSVYLTTFPFTDRDIKKYAWLFANGLEDVYLSEPSSNLDHDDYSSYPAIINHRRSRSPYYDGYDRSHLPSLFLSRALDTNVIPEDSGDKKIRYWIVIQNKVRAEQGTKFLVAESRQAAGILMYYEALSGNSVLFVGAVVHQCGKVSKGMKIKRVESLDEAVSVQEEGFLGIIC